MPAEDYGAILAFAADFSSNNREIVAQVRQLIANSPTDLETIGFHGAEDDPPRNRLFLATVNLLDSAEKLFAAEDKYTPEIFAVWQDEGVIDAKTLPPAAKAVFGPFLDDNFAAPQGDSAEAYRLLVWNQYAQATRELEQHIAARGKVLLSIDATDGDTMFFALVPPEVAARWRDKALSVHSGYHAGVRAPMWDRFWVHLGYGAGNALIDGKREGYPPGITPHAETIPLAE